MSLHSYRAAELGCLRECTSNAEIINRYTQTNTRTPLNERNINYAPNVQSNIKRLLVDDPSAFSDCIPEIAFHERRVW